MDVIRSLTRRNQIGYHLAEAEAWLAESENGTRNTLVSYAAFELRLELERIAVELLARIRGDSFVADDAAALRTFGRIESRIYELEGHQRTLDRKIAFFNTVLAALQMERRVQPINLGRLRSAWQSCSELCHIGWSLVASASETEQLVKEAFDELSEIQHHLRLIVGAGISWPRIADASFSELQAQYVREEVGDEQVRAWLGARGLWAQTVMPDGSTDFVGVAIPPAAADQERV